MAKSKLYAQLRTAVGTYGQMYDVLLKEAKNGAIPDDMAAIVDAKATAVTTAFAEAHKYFEGLERRMGPDKTVGDRLKNLKNVFKDGNQLAAERKRVKADLDKLEDLFLTVEGCIAMVKKVARDGI